MHDGRGIANLILDYVEENGVKLTNLSLQKIIYFCHVWFLVCTGKPLIRHNFEAWEYGPVLPYLYRYFSIFGDKELTDRATQLDHKTGKRITATTKIDEGDENLLRNIVNFYSHLSIKQLVELSHTPGGPWCKAWNHESKVNPGMQISNEEIIRFYSSEQRPYTLQ